MKKFLIYIGLFLICAVSMSAQEKPTAYINARIILIVGQPFEQGVMIVENGKITAVGDARTVRLSPDAMTIIDLQGKIIMPGLVDSHSHIGEGSRGRLESDSAGNSPARFAERPRFEHPTRPIGRHYDRQRDARLRTSRQRSDALYQTARRCQHR